MTKRRDSEHAKAYMEAWEAAGRPEPRQPGQASGSDVRFVDASKLRDWLRQIEEAQMQIRTTMLVSATQTLKSVHASIDREMNPWSAPAAAEGSRRCVK